MGLSVNTNIAALNAYRNLSSTQNDLSKSLEKLSSGLRINRAADDAAGLAISEGLRAQIGGTTQAVRNAQDGISVVQTAEGALTETHSILQRMRTLSVQASNDGGLSSTAKSNIQDEVKQLQTELTRISDTTTFNGKKLLDGNYSGVFQVGANTSSQDQITVDLVGKGLSAQGLGVDTLSVGGSVADAKVTGGVAGTIDPTSGSGSAASLTFADDTAVAGWVTGLADATSDFSVNGKAVDVTGVTTRAGLALAINGTAGVGVTADASGGANIALTNTAHGTTAVAASGATLVAGAAGTADTITGAKGAQFSATIDLANVGGKITLGDRTLDLDAVAATFNADTTDAQKTTAVNTALSAFVTGNAGLDQTALANPTALTFTDGKATLTLKAATPTAAGDTGATFKVDDTGSAKAAIDKIDSAITSVSKTRSQLGAVQNRFDHTINNLNVAVENLSASESRIRDTDMASEMVSYTRASILSQAGTAMLAQAKSLPQSVLQLLQ
jgi:flagellin